MDIAVLVMGVLVAFFGILLLISPKSVVQLSDFLNRSLFRDEAVFARRVAWGVIFIAAGLLFFFTSYQYWTY